ncbi:unnamed protein product [Allacma fusca]|uniref:Meiotic nuclear division protein 1 homolog n=1 Tax=Allacma fusca TaxID=39272 RepID=A0A8J2L4Z1_9HEXA|nr:unnamed protein product [Allacma fusca]
MSKRKGLSLEEKRKRMLDLFYERKDVFQLKELEKIAPKEKGIISQSVKEVVQGLVDDGYVDSDKIGTSVYFWAFPSKAAQVRHSKLDQLTQEFDTWQEKRAKMETEVESIKKRRKNEDSEELLKLMSRIPELKALKTELEEKISLYQENDPEVIAKERADIDVARDAANRWTDNIFVVKSWLKNKFGVDEGTINKQFDIPEDLDCLE